MEREPKEYGIAVVATYLFGTGLTVEEVAQKLTKGGYLANPTPDKKGVSVSIEPYDGYAVHPLTTVVMQNPPTKASFGPEPE